MDYESAIYCRRCGRKAPRWISWSEANPGRRYYACVEAQHGFVQWHDGPTSAFLRVLLGDLRDRVWMVENEAAAMCKDQDAGAGVCVEAQKRNEQTSSTGYSLARKGLMLIYFFQQMYSLQHFLVLCQQIYFLQQVYSLQQFLIRCEHMYFLQQVYF
ncbi:hypothetical protein D1007_02221 [Hordeum vulgare]|nr:hypothetical protein D1007_02221 [Hordeum vulgare]